MNLSSKDGTPVDQGSTTGTSASEGTAGGTSDSGLINPQEVTVVEPPHMGESRETPSMGVHSVPTTRQLGAQHPVPFGLHCDRPALGQVNLDRPTLDRFAL